MKILRKNDLRPLMYGSAFYGGGGGGSMEEGSMLMDLILSENPDPEIRLTDVSEMDSDPKVLSTMVACMGSPAETKGMTFADEAINAVRGMQTEAAYMGCKLRYIYSGEMGSGNTLLPLYTALKLGMAMLDADGNGRAVPEMSTSLAPLHDVPTSPFMIANGKGDTVAARAKDPMDSGICETIARNMCTAFFPGVGFSAWLMNKEDHLRASALGQITKALEVGKILAGSTPDVVLEKLERYFEGESFQTLVRDGTIEKIQIKSEGGFDTGTTSIRDNATGEVFTIVFQNESLFVRGGSGDVLLTVPGITAILDLGRENEVCALSNCEIEEDQHVAVVLLNACEAWYDRAECFDCWKEILESAGYTGPEVRLKGVDPR